MSEVTTTVNVGNQLFNDYDTTKIFLWNNRTESANYTNDTYDDVTIAAGTVMGRVNASGEIIPSKSDAADGSQFPIGVLYETTTIPEGETVALTICVAGDVAADKLVFEKVGDGLNTIVDGKLYRDRIASDSVGIILKDADELTGHDNS